MEIKKNKVRIVVATVALTILVSVLIGYQMLLKKDEIHIAMVGPMTGGNAAVGKSFEQGVRLYLDMINQKGGIDEKKIVLDVFDDRNDAKKANDMAMKIVEGNRAVAVIGHHYSACSIEAGKVYKNFEIPAVSPASTHVNVTKGNEWYFRSSFNDQLQGRFLANYAYEVLAQKSFSIIYEDAPYGKYLAKVFENAAGDKGVRIKHKWEFKLNDRYLDQDLEQIVDDLYNTTDAGVVFLAAHATEGVKLIKLMKDRGVENPIIAPDAFASETFQQAFNDFKREKNDPGFYTDGLYVTTPLIFDTTNEKGLKFREAYKIRYNEEPGWHAAFAYDTAMVIVEAIKSTKIEGRQRTVNDDRLKIRDWLANLDNAYDAIEGITGYNFFDKQGDSRKAIFMGVYRNQKLISALTQFRAIPNIYQVPDYKNKREKGEIVDFDGKPSYKINVVYTGVKINEIKELDTKKFSYLLDFYLWFRYKGDLKIDEIDFLNASQPITLDKSSQKKTDKKPGDEVQKTTGDDLNGMGGMGAPAQTVSDGNLNYRLYHIQKNFRGDFLPNLHTFGQHILGLSFRPRAMDRNSLILVKDVLGMRLKNDQSLLKRMRRDQVLSDTYGWKMNEVLFFQDIAEKELLGNPAHFKVRGGTLEYSRFNMGIRIVKDKITLRQIIPDKLSGWIMVPSFIASLLFISFAGRKNRKVDTKAPEWNEKSETKEDKEKRRKEIGSLQLIWVAQVITCTFFLLSLEVYILYEIAEQLDTKLFTIIVRVFDIVWWLSVAVLASMAMKRFVWTPIEENTRQPIPKIVRGLIVILLFIFAGMAIVAFVFDQKLTSLLATSGMVAMIVGLAVQVNIANVFSGIAINIERPFKIDDWVKIGDFKEGKVTDINWRTTRVKTRDDTILNIPNSQASESSIENFSAPSNCYWKYFTIHVDPRESPERVKKVLLDAALSTKGVLREPKPPGTRFLGLTAGMTGQSESWAANYLIGVYVEDYGDKFKHNELVWLNVYTHLKYAGIRHLMDRQEVLMTLRKPEKIMVSGGEDDDDKERKERKKLLLILKNDLIFKAFSDTNKKEFSEKAQGFHYVAEGVVMNQGDKGDSLFIVTEGSLSITVDMNGKMVEVARVGTGAIVGERALLTGEPRGATVSSITETDIFEIKKSDIDPLLKENPEIIKKISEIIAKRDAENEAKQKGIKVEEAEKNIASKLFGEMQKFFYG